MMLGIDLSDNETLLVPEEENHVEVSSNSEIIKRRQSLNELAKTVLRKEDYDDEDERANKFSRNGFKLNEDSSDSWN